MDKIHERKIGDLHGIPYLKKPDRYITSRGEKLYTMATNINNIGINYCMTFFAWQKYYKINNDYDVMLEFIVPAPFIHILDNDYLNKFFYSYGMSQFRKHLNELDVFSGVKLKYTIKPDDYETHKVIANKGDIPIDYVDEERLINIAEEIILREYYHFTNDRIRLEDLLDKAFVPQRNFLKAYNNLKELNYLDENLIKLTKEGIAYYKNIDRSIKNFNYYSKTVFVAQSFNEDILKIYKEIYEPVINSFNLSPILISNLELKENVDESILIQISNCRFLICDLTYARPSVYFECGYATGKDIKIIFTCRDDHNSDNESFNAKNNKVHFDIRNRKISFWNKDNLENFKEELKNRIKIFIKSQEVK